MPTDQPEKSVVDCRPQKHKCAQTSALSSIVHEGPPTKRAKIAERDIFAADAESHSQRLQQQHHQDLIMTEIEDSSTEGSDQQHLHAIPQRKNDCANQLEPSDINIINNVHSTLKAKEMKHQSGEQDAKDHRKEDPKSLHGIVISVKNDMTVVLPFGELEKEGALVIKDEVNLLNHDPIINNADRFQYLPITTTLKDIEFDETTFHEFRIFRKIIGVIKSCKIVRTPVISEQFVLCSTSFLNEISVADTKTREYRTINTDSISASIFGKSEGMFFLMKTVKVGRGSVYHQSSSSYIPAGKSTTEETELLTGPKDILVDLIAKPEYKELALDDNTRESWIKIANIITAVDAINVARTKQQMKSAVINGKITGVQIFNNATTLQFSLKRKEQSADIAQCQKEMFEINSTALIICDNGQPIKLKVKKAFFNEKEVEIVFQTNFAIFKERFGKQRHDIDGMEVKIQSTFKNETSDYEAFSQKILKKTLPVWSKTATPESKSILTAMFGKDIKVVASDEKIKGLNMKAATEQQSTAVKYAVEGVKTVCAIEGPAGCGKSYTSNLLVQNLIENNLNLPVLATSKANKPGYFIAEKVEQFCNEILIISANSAIMNLNHTEKMLQQKYGLKARVNQVLARHSLKKAEKQLLTEYKLTYDDSQRNNAAYDREDSKEMHSKINECISLIIRITKPKLIIATLSVASRYTSLAKYVQYLLVEEADMVPQLMLASFVAELPLIKGLFMVGDTRESDGFSLSMPSYLQNYGYNSALAAVKGSGVYRTYLEMTHRFAPEMIPLIAECCYNNILMSALCQKTEDCIEGALQISAQYRMLFIDCPGFEKECFPTSRMNEEQGKVALEAAIKLKKTYPNKSVAVASMYGKQHEYVMNYAREHKIENIEFSTVDSLHGAEKDFVIVCLTVSNFANQFVNDKDRFNLAITRARLGCVIVGNLRLMKTKYSSWSQMIQMLENAKSIDYRFKRPATTATIS